MSIALKLGSNGNLQRLAVGESLQADYFERLSAAGNLAIGSTLIAGETLLVGSASAKTQVQGPAALQSYLDYAALDPTGVTWLEGRLFYDNVEHTLSLMNDKNGVLLQIGLEMYLRVVNKTGSTIPDGSAVYLSGVQGNRPTIGLAIATSNITARCVGVTTHDIANNLEGWVTITGTLGYNTSAFTPGLPAYVSDTVAGALTQTAPVGPNKVWLVGIPLNSTSNGRLLARPSGPDTLTHLFDVLDGTPTSGNYLKGDGTYWTTAPFTTDVLASVGSVTSEPSGFYPAGYTHPSTISKVDGTLTFSIAPTGASFDFWVKGVKYTKSTTQSVTWTDVEGTHFFYFDSTGTLVHTTDETAWVSALQGNGALVAALYWDATNNVGTLYEERHGIQMDGSTHLYLHRTRGAQLVSGGALGDLVVDGSGNLATHAEFSVGAVVLADEDIELRSSETTQQLSLPAQIDVYYQLGAAGAWRRKSRDNYPFIWADGVTWTDASTRPAYNQYTGGAWQLTAVTNGNYFLCHYFAVGSTGGRVIGICGQNMYTTTVTARAGAQTEISNLLGVVRLLSKEAVPLATVMYQCGTGYANTPRTRIVSVDAAGTTYVDWRTAALPTGAAPTVHSNLAGLTADDHLQYALLAGRAGGQTLYGGTAASENLTLRSTQNATKGAIVLGDSPLNANNYNVGNMKTAWFNQWASLTPSAGAITVDYSSYQQATVSLNAATVTITLTAPPGPTALRLKLVQDATGSRAVAWATGSKPYAPSGTLTVASAANAVTLIGLVYDGTNWYAVSSQPMQQVA